MIEIWLIALLSILNLVQFFFWSAQVHRLVNKLMSKDFAEYNAVVNGPQPPSVRPVDLEAVAEEEDILKELNAMVSTS